MITGAHVLWFPDAASEIRSASTAGRVEVAERVVDEAQDNAPVVTGAYRDNMHVEVSGDDVSVVDDDPKAFFKEYGTIHTPPHGVITEAAQGEGDYHGPRPR